MKSTNQTCNQSSNQKRNFLLSLGLALSLLQVSVVSLARQGENDGREEDGGMITCTDLISGAQILQFSSLVGMGNVSTDQYELTVKSRGDDVAQMSITDKRSGDTLSAKRLEELLKVTLTSANGSAPIAVETLPARGQAQIEVSDPQSGDKGSVHSLSRRRQSVMRINFTTTENLEAPTNLQCQRL